MKLKILLVEDSALDRRALIDAFENYEPGNEVKAVARAEEALELLKQNGYDILVTDQNLPGITGLELCQAVLSHSLLVPLVILTGSLDDEVAITALKLGVEDFVVKDASGSYLEILPLKLPAIVSRFRDKLARARAEEQLRRHSAELKEQNEDLDAFAYMVAHDIVSPLSILKGYVDTLQQGYGASVDATTELILRNIASSTKKVVNIVDALLMLVSARKDNIELTEMDMGAIVAEVVERVGAEACARVTIPQEWPAALGFGPWVEEVWTNYLTNALKYGGDPAGIELGARVEGDKVRFYVRDQGPGLDKEEQLMVFYPFQRLEPGKSGHGLGLTIVQRIVEKMGGQVGVSSELGAGSEFYFCLPRA